MPEPLKALSHIFLDTSYLRDVGFENPDFRKLLEYSKSGQLKIFVSHIAWEERRTQYLEKAYAKVVKIQNDFDTLRAMQAGNFILGGLPAPGLTIWGKAEIEARSHDVMAAFAKDNKITIVALAPDHAERAWGRYFKIDLPFNRDQERENRRKDIPDSWILEAALDLKREFPGLAAICSDRRFGESLEALGIRAFRTTQEVLDQVEAPPKLVATKVKVRDSALARESEKAAGRLEAALAKAAAGFDGIDNKVLGFVSYLGSPSKDQLYGLLERTGVPTEVARNTAERLAIAKVIVDTGNHFLVGDKDIGDLAAAEVEGEIIKLIEGGE